ncbi:13767_t:CDS:2, partial [Entrophospora sp. SA101]
LEALQSKPSATIKCLSCRKMSDEDETKIFGKISSRQRGAEEEGKSLSSCSFWQIDITNWEEIVEEKKEKTFNFPIKLSKEDAIKELMRNISELCQCEAVENNNNLENYSKKTLNPEETQQLLADIDDGLIKVKKNAEGKQEVDKKETQQLLADIDDGLIKVKKNAEGKQEVDKKVGEFRDKIDNALSNELGALFPNQGPEKVKQALKKLSEELEKERSEYKAKLEGLQNTVIEASRKSNSSNYSEVIGKISESINGENGLIMSCTKSVAGGGHFVDKTIDKVDNAREDLKDFSEHIADNTADLIKEGMSDLTKVAEGFFNIFHDKAKPLEEKLKASETYIETLQQQVARRDKQLEEQSKDFKQRLENRDERIEKKDARIETLEKQVEKLMNAQLEHLSTHSHIEQ